MPRRIKRPSLPKFRKAKDAGDGTEPTTAEPGPPESSESVEGAPETGTSTESLTTDPPTLGSLEFDSSDRRERLEQMKRPALIAGGVLGIAALGVGIGYALFNEGSDPVRLPAVAPTVVIEQGPEPEAAEQIGFPAFATQNTTRVGGVDPVSDAAGVALASYPSLGGVGGPRAVTMVPEDSWQSGIAAASLSHPSVGAPILLGRQGEIPGFTAEALQGLSPQGVKRADGVQLLAVGDIAVPEGLEVQQLNGSDPARLAKLIDRQRGRLSGIKNPRHIVVASSEDPGFAMPAAAWAALSGDPVVFAAGDEVPQPTLDVIESHPDARVYVLGPASVISDKALDKIENTAGRAIRVAGPDPVANAINFARFVDGTFGWDINDPGHGFAIANTARPSDAGAAAPLAAGGKPGPMLLTDSATEMPRALRAYLLDTKPGFSDDPTRAIYNHVWLIGDTSAISLDFQAQVDALTQLDSVDTGSGTPDFGTTADKPEAEVDLPEPDDAPSGSGR